MPAIDAHVHLFPDEPSGLMAQGGERLAGYAGVVEDVHRIAERRRIDRTVALTTGTAELFRRIERRGWPREVSEEDRHSLHEELEERLWLQVANQNDWICDVAAAEEMIVAAIAADPTVDARRMAANLREKAGLPHVRAIKIHPAMSFVFPDDPGFDAAYGVARDAGLVVISHGGSSSGTFYESDVEYCAPPGFAPVLRRLPELRLVVAHCGQPFHEALLELGAAHENVFTDLSFVLGGRLLEQAQLAEFIRDFGVERVLFGSDFPYFDPEDSLDRLEELGLTSSEFELVSEGNADRLFFQA